MQRHIPVLLEEALQSWSPAKRVGGYFVDGTVGFGGHSEALLTQRPEAKLLCIDRDPDTLENARKRLHSFGSRVIFQHGSYQNLADHLKRNGFPLLVDGILLDLGVNSFQIDNSERGFSFMTNGPLDMRFDQTDAALETAAALVNKSSEVELTRIFELYGQEPFAKEAAKAITRRRKQDSFEFKTTADLRACLEAVLSRWKTRKKIHPATLCFQALRIAVNHELDHVEQGLTSALESLSPASGRLVVISFHSLEDKFVKHCFRDYAKAGNYKITTKRAIKPSEQESEQNRRSRSARLRCIERSEVASNG